MEVASAHRTMAVTEASQPSAARYLARGLAETAGFNEDDVSRAAIVATEMATNLVKHARGGELLGRISGGAPAGEIELIAIDRGPGMTDVSVSMVDGHSTRGSSGTGLGAVRRLSDTFDVFSDARGTVVLGRLRAGRRAPPSTAKMVTAGVSIAKAGETVCGDAWHVRPDADGATIVVADGLGHGVQAAEAAAAALAAFAGRPHPDSLNALRAMHDAVRHTRGAAAAVATIRGRAGVVRYAGLGNIFTTLVHDSTVRHAVSHNGTLGHEARVMREYTYPWLPGALIVMHSDGLVSHWSLDSYRGLRQRHPAVVASVLYRDHNRGRDDVTVLVGRDA